MLAGARAYTTSIAALAALKKRNIISRNGKSCVKLLVSNSGGSWAIWYIVTAPRLGKQGDRRGVFETGNAQGNCPMVADIKKDNVAHLSKKNAAMRLVRKNLTSSRVGTDYVTWIWDFWKAQIIEYYMEPYNITDKVMDCSNGEHNGFDSIFVGTLAGPSKQVHLRLKFITS